MLHPLWEFRDFIDVNYGSYLDALSGFSEVCKKAETLKSNAGNRLQKLQELNPEFRNFTLGGVSHVYGRVVKSGEPYQQAHIHQCDVDELVARNQRGGHNEIVMGSMILVTIYQYWDDRVRAKLALRLGLQNKNAIKVPLLGDIRIFRTSIIHNSSVAIKDVGKCEILKWFTPGDHVNLNKKHIEQIVDGLMQFITGFEENRTKYIVSEGPEEELRRIKKEMADLTKQLCERQRRNNELEASLSK